MIYIYTSLKTTLNKLLTEITIKKKYLQTLENKTEALRAARLNEYRSLNSSLFHQILAPSSEFLNQKLAFDSNLMIMYIITLTVTRSNFYLNISNLEGKLKLSVSAGNFKSLRGIKAKKTLTIMSFKAIFKLIYKQKYLVGKPIVLHLRNREYIPRVFLKQLQKKRFLKIITFFPKTPFNGCRKKKVRSGGR